MTNAPRDPFRRTIWIIALAIILPASIIFAMDLSFGLARQRDKIEQKSLDTADTVSLLADARVRADFATMSVLATAVSLKAGDWRGFYDRANEVRGLNAGWRTVILTDFDAGRELLDLRRPFEAGDHPMAARLAGRSALPRREVGDIQRTRDECTCIPLDVGVVQKNGRRLLVTVQLDPSVFQIDLLTHAGDRFVTLVDRHAFILARWRDIDKRLGTPVSERAQQAITKGPSGVFSGRTLEGVSTMTAYVISPLTGWSVLVGVPVSVVDTPYTWSVVAGAAGVVAALGIAAFLASYAIGDLAARRREEARGLQTQKMEAIGRLTGSIAHDFNNLLTVVIGNLELLAKRVDDPAVHRLVERADGAARRGAKLVSQLLAFSRSHELQIVVVDLRSLLPGMRDLLEQSLGKGVELEIEIVDPAPLVTSDVNQLELALLNLAINARDAMSGAGRFRLRIEAARRDPEAWVTIAASDTGSGMTREVAARAFEPFFTTKETGLGTGLGLAQVFATISRSGGTVHIETEPGKGTTFFVTLPRAVAHCPEPLAEGGETSPMLTALR